MPKQLTLFADYGEDKDYTTSIPALVLALFFIVIGLEKLYGLGWVDTFERLGVGQWFRYLTGALQVTGGLLLMPRRTARVGTVMLGSTMLGATTAQALVLGNAATAIVPALFLLLVATFGWRHGDRSE